MGCQGWVVAFGDSITDGFNSTADVNRRWPDNLARRLAASPQRAAMGVLNAGLDGNRLLSGGPNVSALARFDRDVLVQTGVTHVVVLIGVNDLGAMRDPAGVDALIAGHLQLIERARARG